MKRVLALALALALAPIVASACNPVVRVFGGGSSSNGGAAGVGGFGGGFGGFGGGFGGFGGDVGGAGGSATGLATSASSSGEASSSGMASSSSSSSGKGSSSSSGKVSSSSSSVVSSSSSSSGGGTYCPATFSPIGQWLFSGNTADTSGNGDNGTIVGGVALAADRNGAASSAYQFNGTNGEIDVPTAAILSGMATLTVSAWVYPNTPPSSGYIVYKQNGGFSPGYTLRASNGPWIFGVGPSDVYAQAPGLPVVGAWTQLVGTFDGKTITLYVNGAEVAATASTQPPGTNTDLLTFGGPTYFFDGRIDDIRIYACAMSAAQVAAAYTP